MASKKRTAKNSSKKAKPKEAPAPKAEEPTPDPSPPPEPVTAFSVTREEVFEAVYLESLERGLDKREARAAAEDVADRLRLPGVCPEPVDREEPGFYDLRHEQDYVYPRGARKVLKRGNAVVRRDPSTIDTLVVHQTAIEFGVSERQVRLAGGDAELALARRALDAACHVMAFRAGFFVASHPLRDFVNAANRLNPESLNLEIDGRYAGLEDDPATAAREDLLTTWRGEPTELTEETVAAARAAIRWLVEEAAREGIAIRKITGHRISNDARRADPGEGPWKRVVLPAAEELGLEVIRRSPWNQGEHIPTDWDPEGIGAY